MVAGLMINVRSRVFFSELITVQESILYKVTCIFHAASISFSNILSKFSFLNVDEMNQTNSTSIAVIFEVVPADGKKDEYLDIAASLKPELEKIKGFISVERFQSLTHPEKILSLSFWENEEAIQNWRTLEHHRIAQAKGREYIFKDYHLRIAAVVRDYGMFDRKEAPVDSKSYHR
jgi:heme-degrading monooxygenase HmoA